MWGLARPSHDGSRPFQAPAALEAWPSARTPDQETR